MADTERDDTTTPPTEPDASTAVAEKAEGAAPEAAAEGEPEKLNQQVEMSDVGPCKKHIKVTVDRKDIDTLFDKKYTELVRDYSSPIDGFRPGKAPRKIIERRFQKDVAEQVKAEVLMASLEQLAGDVTPISPPNIEPNKIVIPESGPLVYEFDVEVRPEFDLPSYKGLKLRRPVKTFTDADVAAEEKRLLDPYGQIVPKPNADDKPAAVEMGDYVVADITVRFGNKVLNTMTEVRLRVDTRLVLNDGVAEDFAKTMVGAKAGDEKMVEIKLSDNVANPDFRGVTVQATFLVKEIKTTRVPELTPDVLEKFGVRTPEAFRELIKLVLERRLEYSQRQSARAQVLEQISAASQWDLPQDLLVRQARQSLQRRAMEMRNAGIAEEEIGNRLKLMQQDVIRSTALALKEHFVLQKIAEVEKIEIEEVDIDDEIERIAARTDESPRRVRARLEKEDLIETLATELIERKALDLVLQNAEYEDHPLDADEGTLSSTTAQVVPGELRDPTAEQPKAEGEEAKPEGEPPAPAAQ
jgi:trigger factor